MSVDSAANDEKRLSVVHLQSATWVLLRCLHLTVIRGDSWSIFYGHAIGAEAFRIGTAGDVALEVEVI